METKNIKWCHALDAFKWTDPAVKGLILVHEVDGQQKVYSTPGRAAVKGLILLQYFVGQPNVYTITR